ncbi:MAG: TAXI family TRAP transporter solute-binding subunit [Geminicoccaceae bacterium]
MAGLAITGPAPSEAVQDMLKQPDGRAQLLELSNWQTAQVTEGWHVHQLTADDYPELSTHVDAIARTLLLVAHRDVSEDAVYQIVKMMFDNLPFLTNIEPQAAQISLDHALNHESNLPFHPGAARYYEEIGVLAEGGGDPGAAQLDAVVAHADHAALDRSAYAEQDGAEQDGELPPERVHDEAMLTGTEVHDGQVTHEIVRPNGLRPPGTEISVVYFNLGRTDLAGAELAKIPEITGRIMATYDSYGREPEIYVEGHTNSSGSRETNHEIARSRAQSVSNLLIAGGVPDSWIHITDYSEQDLAVLTADGIAEERNRRVEITVIPQE